MDPDPTSQSAATADLSEQLQQAALAIEQLRLRPHLRLRGEYWFGKRADAVRRSWDSIVGPALEENAAQLWAMSRHVSEDTFDDGTDPA